MLSRKVDLFKEYFAKGGGGEVYITFPLMYSLGITTLRDLKLNQFHTS
jgi:hypothetical protein